MKRIHTFVLSGVFGVALIGLTACETAHYRGRDVEVGVGRTGDHGGVVVEREHHGGPPDHAPAHGYRRQHEYRYYKTAHVYYEPARKMYWYIRGDNWEVAGRLPDDIRLGNDYVTMELDTDRPYIHYDEHKVKYPSSKRDRDRDKDRGRGKGKGKKRK